jgi:predicted transcriptional regulator
MNYDQLLKHFKTQVAAAKALKISQPAVSNWKVRGIPAMQQVKINKVTKGALKIDKGIL